MDKDKITILGPEIGLIVEIEVNFIIKGKKTFTLTEIIGPTIELEVGLGMVMGMEIATEGMIDMIVEQIMEETITDKTMETKGTGIEAQVKTKVGLGQDIEVTPGITLGMGPIIEAKVRIEVDQAVEMKGKGQGQFQETE